MKLAYSKKSAQGDRFRRSRSRILALLAFVALAAITALSLYIVKNPIWVAGSGCTTTYIPSSIHSPEGSSIQLKSASVTLFFSDPDSGLLIREKRSIVWNPADLKSQVRAILYDLQKGSKQNLLNPMPALAQVRDISFQGDMAVLDFSRELRDHHPGGSLAEMHTIYAIVNSVTLNIASVKKVQILIEGKTVETLKGHIDCRSPLAPNFSLIKAS
ncbi:MAG TPA: GerMN domain-containing protein [Thermodesulfobacteriota bacterium]|nr:GerMN domain-containing protein [Deltaproteobacteria bacterium]HNU72287.1 GerMN domain-containing protein [Thermodesulfobacteriota bacterium]HQO78884.1 GerMN domain-containing protein [Thermodesulfobacteriota bacterium]